jgi:hypothetical protein
MQSLKLVKNPSPTLSPTVPTSPSRISFVTLEVGDADELVLEISEERDAVLRIRRLVFVVRLGMKSASSPLYCTYA